MNKDKIVFKVVWPPQGDRSMSEWLRDFLEKDLQQTARHATIELPHYSGHRMKWHGFPPVKKVWPTERPSLTLKAFWAGFGAALILVIFWMLASVYLFHNLDSMVKP